MSGHQVELRNKPPGAAEADAEGLEHYVSETTLQGVRAFPEIARVIFRLSKVAKARSAVPTRRDPGNPAWVSLRSAHHKLPSSFREAGFKARTH
jgi:hypothetical protein